MGRTSTKSAAARTATSEFEFVHELVRAQAELHPDRSAIRDCDGTEISYGLLMDRSHRLASALRAVGAGPDVPVAVYLARSADVIVAMLAILEADAVYAPIDNACPPARVLKILENLDAKVLIADELLPADVAPLGVVKLHPAKLGDVVAQDPGVGSRLAPDALSYILHTSGSTGSPKGVAMTHRGLTRLIRWQLDDGPRGLTTLNFTSMGFDVTFQEVLSTFASGGCLCLISDPARQDPDQLLAMIADESIQRIFLPYVMLQQLAKAAQRSNIVPSSLCHVITAGERLVISDAVVEFFRQLPGCRLDNHYGPTEAHLVTSFTLPADRASWQTFPSIGRPVSGADVYLLDANLARVSIDAEGEVYVAGNAIARGYLHAPGQTAERFLPDPFHPDSGGRMYRTGDIARLDTNGLLHFVGRIDTQTKVHGYRVEPAEVEHALGRHPNVRDCAVVVRALSDEMQGLSAYVVLGCAAVSITELAEYLRDYLPSYMIPSRFVFVDALPLTATGKVDRRTLTSRTLPAVPDIPTRSAPLADIVTAVWQRVLGHDEFGDEDDFFDVGGDSRLAAWAVAELSQVVGRELQLSLLLQESTVGGLAACLAKLDQSAVTEPPDSEILTLRVGPSGRALFMFHALGGELFSYRALVKEMTSPLRVLGMRWAGDPSRIPSSVSELARTHVDRIRAVQPHGPYSLGGWSFGGMVAFEAACQLETSGEQVEFLGLVDANPIRDPISGQPPQETPYLAMLAGIIEQIRSTDLADDRQINVSEFASERTWSDLMGTTLPLRLSIRQLMRQLQVACGSMKAAMSYQPHSYGGDVELFHALGTKPEIRESLIADLRGIVRGTVNNHVIPGNHTGMLGSPCVGILAAALDSALQHHKKGN